MYGPIPTAPPRRRRAGVGIVLLRVVLTAIPVLSIGFLSWITMLYLAIVHRRIRDWLLFSAVAAAVIGPFVLLQSLNDESWQHNTGMALLLGTAVFTPAYFLAVELRPQRPHATPRQEIPPAVPLVLAPPGYQPPVLPRQNRIEQVRSGLDELSAYLEQQDRS